MAEIYFDKVTKSFGNVKVIEDLDLTIQDSKFTVLVGPSGCGKTTLLRMVAGIGPATSGKIFMDGREITDLAPGKRDIAMVFQNYAIYPTMNVRENIEFGLKNNKVPKLEREKLIKEVADSVGLLEYLDRKPGTLSGGQRQRVALARAMVKKPKVFLMDEPLSNLDAKLRAAMRTELIEIHKNLKTTFIYVTHDQVEAMAMADTIVLMNKGKILQEGTPEEIYKDPNNIFVAQFIGTPPMNILPIDNENKLGFRPEKTQINQNFTEEYLVFRGIILTREMLGAETLYKIKLPKGVIMAKTTEDIFEFDQKISVGINKKDTYFFDKNDNRIREDKDLDYLFKLSRSSNNE